MTNVARAQYDAALAELAAVLGRLRTARDLEDVRRSGTLAGAAGALASPDDPRVLHALRAAAGAGAATWSLARAGGRELMLPLLGRAVPIAGTVEAELLSPRRWLDDFWLALLLDDPQGLAALCYAPSRHPERAAPYVDLLAEAMRDYWLHDDHAAGQLIAALRASDPKHLGPDDADRALYLDVPVIECLFTVFERDTPKLDAALARAFAHHRTYWAGSRVADPRGWFSPALAAIVAHATRIGIAVTARSACTPAALLQAGYDGELLLCPYCMSPIVHGIVVCPACLEDTTRDAWIETDLDAFHGSERAPCGRCGTNIDRLAVRCPSCRNPPR